MATRKSVSSSSTQWGLCLTCLVLMFPAAYPAAETKVPPGSPAPPSAGAPMAAEVRTTIDELTRELRECRDESAARLLQYRLGIARFKAGQMAEAAAAFAPLAHAPQTPDLLRVCSLNMMGQIARLQGEQEKALQAFADLAARAEKWPTLDPQDRDRPALRTLWRAALISRAEILESRKDLAAAAEYERLLQGEKDCPPDAADANQMPLVMDRLAELRLQTQDTGRYLELTAELVGRFPAYRRTAMVELERVCVQALQDVPSAPEYPSGALSAPARFIAYLRRGGAAGPAAAALDNLERLCRKYAGTPSALLLDYDYAWMLDAVGRPDQALAALARIAAPGEPGGAAAPEAALSQEEVLRRYAVLQRVLLLAERRDYDKALQILAGLPPAPDRNSHVSRLAESMTRSVQTLKREVARNVPYGEK